MKLKHTERNTDRHGNVRVYVRKDGRRLGRLYEKEGTPEFMAEYLAVLNGSKLDAPKHQPKALDGSLSWLCQQYYVSAEFRGLDKTTRARRRSTLERICVTYGPAKYVHMEKRHVLAIVDERAGTPEAANADVKAIRGLFKWAINRNHANFDPTAGIGKLKPKNADGFHVWSEAEIEKYEAKYPIGTKQRLALDLLLYTGVRKSDVVKFGPQMERDGALHFTEYKGRNRRPKSRAIPILPDLRKSIDATKSGHLAYLVTGYGKPFSVGGFGNKMREWCNDAGLPQCSAHGLRKAGATRCAERGATASQIMALFGWESLQQAELYTRAADRKKLTGEAVKLLRSATPLDDIEGGVVERPKNAV
jgi:integrase